VVSAEAEAKEIEALARTRHDRPAWPGILFRRATFQFIHGDLRATEATAIELFDAVRDLSPTRPDATLMHAMHFMNVRLMAGRIVELLPMIAASAAAHPDIFVFQAIWAMASARSGQLDQAREILTHSLRDGLHAIPPDVGWYATVTAFGDAAHVADDTRVATFISEALEPYAGRYAVQGESVSLPIDVVRAELALTMNQPGTAIKLGADAARHAQAQSAPILTARALVLESAGHHQLGQIAPARATLEQATAIAARTGAHLITIDAQRLGLM